MVASILPLSVVIVMVMLVSVEETVLLKILLTVLLMVLDFVIFVSVIVMAPEWQHSSRILRVLRRSGGCPNTNQ